MPEQVTLDRQRCQPVMAEGRQAGSGSLDPELTGNVMTSDSKQMAKRFFRRQFSVRVLLAFTTLIATAVIFLVRPYYQHKERLALVEQHGEVQQFCYLTDEDVSGGAIATTYWSWVSDLCGEDKTKSPRFVTITDVDTPLPALREIVQLKSLEGIDLANTNADDSVVLNLNPHALNWVGLNNTEVTDNCLKHLRELKSLSNLNIYKTLVTENAAHSFEQSRPSVWLNWSPRVSINDREAIRNCVRSDRFYVSHTEIGLKCNPVYDKPVELQYLVGIESSIELVLIGANQSFPGFNEKRTFNPDILRRLSGIRKLHVQSTRLYDLSWLALLPELEELVMINASFTGGFPSLPNLKEIFLVNVPFADCDIARFPLDCKLESLVIDADDVTDRSVARIRQFNWLTKLGLRDSKISREAFAQLAQLENLESLEIDSDKINSIEPIKNLTNLKRLELSRTNVDDDCFDVLREFTDLEYLGLGRTNITRDALFACLVNHLTKVEQFRYKSHALSRAAIPLSRAAIPKSLPNQQPKK